MKFKFLYVSIIAIFIILITSIVFASTGSVDLKSDVNKVKAGETFTVTLYATSEDGINGIDTKFTYDSEKLELISAELADSLKWTRISFAEDIQDITVICNSKESIKSADIYILKFKVKENVSVGDILKVETTNILLSTDAQTDSEVHIIPKKIEFEVIKDQEKPPVEDPPTENPPTENPPTENPPTENPPTENPPTENPPTENPPTENPPTEDPKDKPTDPPAEKQDNKPVDSTNDKIKDSDAKDQTVANKNIPKTGENNIIIIVLIAVSSILLIIFRKKYMKYNI